MNVEEVAIAQATALLTELYKASDFLMTKSDNVDEMKVLVTRVNFAYDRLTSLCSNLSNADLVQSTFITKLDFDSEYWEFKLKVQQWFDKMQKVKLNPVTQIFKLVFLLRLLHLFLLVIVTRTHR